VVAEVAVVVAVVAAEMDLAEAGLVEVVAVAVGVALLFP